MIGFIYVHCDYIIAALFITLLGGGNQHSAYRVSEGDDDYPQERVGCDFSGEEEVEHIGDAVLEAAEYEDHDGEDYEGDFQEAVLCFV